MSLKQAVLADKSNKPLTDKHGAALGEPYNFARGMRGILVAWEIATHPGLLPGARLLWGVIRQLSCRDGKCYASDEMLASKIAMHERVVRKYCRQLIDEGLLRQTRRAGRPPIRELLRHPIFDSNSPVPHVAAQRDPEPEEFQDSLF